MSEITFPQFRLYNGDVWVAATDGINVCVHNRERGITTLNINRDINIDFLRVIKESLLSEDEYLTYLTNNLNFDNTHRKKFETYNGTVYYYYSENEKYRIGLSEDHTTPLDLFVDGMIFLYNGDGLGVRTLLEG